MGQSTCACCLYWRAGCDTSWEGYPEERYCFSGCLSIIITRNLTENNNDSIEQPFLIIDLSVGRRGAGIMTENRIKICTLWSLEKVKPNYTFDLDDRRIYNEKTGLPLREMKDSGGYRKVELQTVGKKTKPLYVRIHKIVALAMIATRYADRFRLSTFDFRLSTFDSSRFFRLNYDLFIRSLCFIVVYVGWTAISSAYGDVELAASALMMKLFMLFSFFIDGFAYAGEALVGKTIGEQQSAVSSQSTPLPGTPRPAEVGWFCEGSRRGVLVRTLFAWGTGVGLFFSLLYALFPDALFAALTSDQQVITTMHKYIGWLIAMPIVSMLAFMWDGIFAGATRGKDIRNAMLWAAAAFAGAYFLLSTLNSQHSTLNTQLSTHSLYIAYFAHLAARVIYLTAKYFRQPILNLK